MNVEQFKILAGNPDEYSISDIEEMEIMTWKEVDDLQRRIEQDTGDYSDWDKLRLCFTCKYLFKQLEENKPEKVISDIFDAIGW